MVIIMEMSTGRFAGEALGSHGERYGDEVLNAGWAEVPRVEDRLEERLEEVVNTTHREPTKAEVDGFMARLYTYQG